MEGEHACGLVTNLPQGKNWNCLLKTCRLGAEMITVFVLFNYSFFVFFLTIDLSMENGQWPPVSFGSVVQLILFFSP